MSLVKGFVQGMLDALPYSIIGSTLAYACWGTLLGGHLWFESGSGQARVGIPLALGMAVAVWIGLFSLLSLYSLSRYRDCGELLPVTRSVASQVLWTVRE